MGKIRSLAALLLLAAGQDDLSGRARETITAADLQEHVKALAADELEGRNSGTDGGEKAAAYIEARFQEYKLKPVGTSEYRQKFRFPVRNDGERRTTLMPREAEAANLLGLIEGREKPEEVVILGAHYDHVGRKGQWNPGRRNLKKTQGDEIWNGADDNASGVAGLLELAQAFSTLQPRRSVLFVAFAAEEHVLKGSEWYRRHPVLPIRKTALMINLDMIGRESESGVLIHGVGTSEPLRPLVERAVKENDLKAKLFDFGDVREPDSDHVWFFEASVPTLFFFTGLHEDYHEPTDHADKLNLPSMERIVRAVFRIAWEAAEAPAPFAFRAPRKLGIFEIGGITERSAEQLKLPKGHGGIWIMDVTEGSPAAAGGLRKFDVLLEFNGTPLPLHDTRKALHRLIDDAPVGRPLPVVVFREGRRSELKIEFK